MTATTPIRPPVFVWLMWGSCAAMLVPAAMALAEHDHITARSFFYSALSCALLTLLLDLTMRRPRKGFAAREILVGILGLFGALPLVLAVPVIWTLQVPIAEGWFEMLSSLSTTGATLLDQGQFVPRAVHLWRAMAGWFGGLFTLVIAAGLMAPMNLGGFEVRAPRDLRAVSRSMSERSTHANPIPLLQRQLWAVLPVYGGLTLALFVGLLIAGDDEFIALTHAMAVLSTSGISAVGGVDATQSGYLGEAVMLMFFAFAFARSTLTPTILGHQTVRARHDPELRLGIMIVLAGAGAIYFQHWLSGDVESASLSHGVQALWGTVFTSASFLSTTGFESQGWLLATFWSGLKAPGLVLLGFAMIGGGVATTAGGVKLMRVWILAQHMRREAQLLVTPHAVGPSGLHGRTMRSQGASMAWVVFMLFALSLAVVMAALSVVGIGFENAMTLAVAALANCGPLAESVSADLSPFGQLNTPAKAVLALAMVAGRVESLALIALLNRDLWRK